jgi:hypothetical protein
MKLAMAIGIVLSIFASSLCAQESIIGKYSGSFSVKAQQGVLAVPVTLQITSVENEYVKAKATRQSVGNRGPIMYCGGEYEMVGTYRGNKLVLKSVSGPSDCVLGFVLVPEGNKLTGTVGKTEIVLSK